MREEIIANFDKIHTTPMGVIRVNKNLGLNLEDVCAWVKEIIADKSSIIERKGKNYYITSNNNIITLNAHSYTIITAHKNNEIL